jgi:hypothetical protein
VSHKSGLSAAPFGRISCPRDEPARRIDHVGRNREGGRRHLHPALDFRCSAAVTLHDSTSLARQHQAPSSTVFSSHVFGAGISSLEVSTAWSRAFVARSSGLSDWTSPSKLTLGHDSVSARNNSRSPLATLLHQLGQVRFFSEKACPFWSVLDTITGRRALLAEGGMHGRFARQSSATLRSRPARRAGRRRGDGRATSGALPSERRRIGLRLADAPSMARASGVCVAASCLPNRMPRTFFKRRSWSLLARPIRFAAELLSAVGCMASPNVWPCECAVKMPDASRIQRPHPRLPWRTPRTIYCGASCGRHLTRNSARGHPGPGLVNLGACRRSLLWVPEARRRQPQHVDGAVVIAGHEMPPVGCVSDRHNRAAGRS